MMTATRPSQVTGATPGAVRTAGRWRWAGEDAADDLAVRASRHSTSGGRAACRALGSAPPRRTQAARPRLARHCPGYPVPMTISCDVLVIGAGAAGLMCAMTAGRRGRRVRVIERANRPGKKILMSGGGRCNFTNTGTGPANFISANPHFCKSALARYTPADFIDMVDRHGIGWHEKELGQLFCSDSSKQIVRMLLDECGDAGVAVDVDCDVTQVARDGEGFVVETARGRFAAQSAR